MDNSILDFQQQPITRQELAKVYSIKKVKELNEQHKLIGQELIKKKENLLISFNTQFEDFIKKHEKVNILKRLLENDTILEYKFTRIMSEEDKKKITDNIIYDFKFRHLSIYDFNSYKEHIIENPFPKLKVSVFITQKDKSINIFDIEEIFHFVFENDIHLIEKELNNIQIELKKDWEEEYNTLLILNSLSNMEINNLPVVKLPEFTQLK